MAKLPTNPNVHEPVENLYIHVPYCRKKCGYCDYYSVSDCLADYELFLTGIKKEWQLTERYLKEHKNLIKPLKTLYFGGGTPSVLPPDILVHCIQYFKEQIGFASDIEITMEVNPEPKGRETVTAGIASGVNRISLGFQAGQNHLLETLGRLHRYQDFLDMLHIVRKHKVENISCDLMFGLPGQTLEEALSSAQILIELNIPHISFYSLILEEKTLFHKKYAEHLDLLPSEDTERAMYRQLLAKFTSNRYHYYELSSVAKTDYYSRHNYNYWSTKPYLGLGPGAHGYFNGIRKGNIRSVRKWLQDPWQSADIEEIPLDLAMREYAMLAFRLAEGFSIRKFEKRFHLKNPFQKQLDYLTERALIVRDKRQDCYYLSDTGLDFANLVFMEFL